MKMCEKVGVPEIDDIKNEFILSEWKRFGTFFFMVELKVVNQCLIGLVLSSSVKTFESTSTNKEIAGNLNKMSLELTFQK